MTEEAEKRVTLGGGNKVTGLVLKENKQFIEYYSTASLPLSPVNNFH